MSEGCSDSVSKGVEIGIASPELIDRLVNMLWSDYWTDRRWSAAELSRIGWKPATKSEAVQYLIASRKWDELRQHGQVAADALIETAETLKAGPRPDPSLSREDDVMEEHVELVEREKADLYDELRQVRHRDVASASSEADSARDEVLSSALDYIYELGGKRGADCVYELADANTAGEYPSDLGFSAVLILSKHGDPRAEKLLRSLICSESADPLLRKFAMDEAGERNHTGLLDLLHSIALDAEAEADIRLAALKSIQKMAGPEQARNAREIGDAVATVRPDVVESLTSFADEPAEIRVAGVDALVATFGAEDVAKAILHLFSEGEYDLDAMAEDLEELRTAAVEPLVALLHHWDSGVQIRAIEALQRIGDPRASGPLTRLLDDKSQAVRSTAEWALRRW